MHSHSNSYVIVPFCLDVPVISVNKFMYEHIYVLCELSYDDDDDNDVFVGQVQHKL